MCGFLLGFVEAVLEWKELNWVLDYPAPVLPLEAM